MLADIWNDWTRLSLATFALISWVMLANFDENHHPLLMLFILSATLATSAGAWFFLRSGSLKGRFLSIIVSFMAAAVIGAISWATWSWHEYYGFPKPDTWYQSMGVSIPMLLMWLLFLFWFALIGAVYGVTHKLQTR